MAEGLPIARLGVYHPRDRCAYCATQAGELELRVLSMSRAYGLVCVDTVACVRRAHERRQLHLFGKDVA